MHIHIITFSNGFYQNPNIFLKIYFFVSKLGLNKDKCEEEKLCLPFFLLNL